MMAEIILPKRVREFRDFVRSRSQLFDKLRKEGYEWQELYDLWDQGGEYASLFQKYMETEETDKKKKEDGQKVNWQDLLNKLSEMDVDRIEKHVKQLSSTLDQIQRISKQVNQRPNQPPSRMGPFF